MTIVGLDLGKRNCQLCMGSEDGVIAANVRVKTTRESLEKAFAGMSRATVLIESSTSSEWVARFLEKIGHKVIVADPRFGPMYARADKSIKTDKRDAAALFHAARGSAPSRPWRWSPALEIRTGSLRRDKSRRTSASCPANARRAKSDAKGM